MIKYLFLITLFSCQTNGHFNNPDAELCIIMQDLSAYCKNSTGEFEVKEPVNFIATSPQSYDLIEDHVSCIEKELIKCYKSSKRCKPSGDLCGWEAKKSQRKLKSLIQFKNQLIKSNRN